ncbi:MAG: polymer-forming cytoskeletal protein [Elusimicrobiota bacterium]
MKKQKHKNSLFGTIETLISQDTKVDGIIEASGTIRVDGIVKGGITKASGVIIGETGLVEGNISSLGVSLAGRVVGNIHAAESLELIKGSSLNGDIKTSKLSIAEGAKFDGTCQMVEDEPAEQAEEPAKYAKKHQHMEPAEDPT